MDVRKIAEKVGWTRAAMLHLVVILEWFLVIQFGLIELVRQQVAVKAVMETGLLQNFVLAVLMIFVTTLIGVVVTMIFEKIMEGRK